jgi:hypothetical protein
VSLLRNCPLDDLAGRAIDEYEAEILGALTQSAEDVSPMFGVLRLGTGIVIDQAMFESVMDHDRQLACCRGQRLRFADANGEVLTRRSRYRRNAL